MARVLHLIDPGAAGGGPCTLRLLGDLVRQLDSLQHDVLLIGTADHVRLAERCGVKIAGYVCPPMWHGSHAWGLEGKKAWRLGGLEDKVLKSIAKRVLQSIAWAFGFRPGANSGRPSTDNRAIAPSRLQALTPSSLTFNPGARQVRSFIQSYSRAGRSFNLMHAWTATSARIAMQTGLAIPCVVTLQAAPEEAWRAGGVEAWGRLRGFKPSSLQAFTSTIADRQIIRRQWFDEFDLDVDDDEVFMIGLLGEPVDLFDAREAAMIAGRVAVAGRKVRLMLHHAVARRREAQEFMRHAGLPGLLLANDEVAEPWRIASALDAALFWPSERLRTSAGGLGSISPLPLLWAAAAGLPIVGEETLLRAALGDVLVHDASALMVELGDSNGASHQIARLHDDRELAARIGNSAKSAILALHQSADYAEGVKQQYELWLRACV
jgi:hypothetical protein